MIADAHIASPFRGDRPQSIGTPRALFAEIARRYGRGSFTLDAAADAGNTLCGHFIDEERNAFETPWFGRVWVNPPYRSILPWCRRAHAELHAGHIELCVMLLPGRPGADWWVWSEQHGARIIPIRGRVSFVPPPGVVYKGAFEWSVLVVWETPLAAEDYR